MAAKGLEVDRWTWRVIQSYSLKSAHINVLEMWAILNALVWKLQDAGEVALRHVHVSDSQVCLSALAKGRTTSKALRIPLQKINALLLVSRSLPYYVYVDTSVNPADAPSRWKWSHAKGSS